MARHHSTAPIPSFPEHIDRQRFGDWISGFSAGEGCFSLSYSYKNRDPGNRTQCKAEFKICLRADDTPILQLIRSYFNCGSIQPRPAPANRSRSNPSCAYYISSAKDLQTIAVPHFEAHPLFAKKATDFAIWKRGVALLYEVNLIHRAGGLRMPARLGSFRLWTKERITLFDSIKNELEESRKYG